MIFTTNFTDFFDFIQENKVSLCRIQDYKDPEGNFMPLDWEIKFIDGSSMIGELSSIVGNNFEKGSSKNAVNDRSDLGRYYYLFANHGFVWDKKENCFKTCPLGSNTAIINYCIRSLIDELILMELKSGKSKVVQLIEFDERQYRAASYEKCLAIAAEIESDIVTSIYESIENLRKGYEDLRDRITKLEEMKVKEVIKNLKRGRYLP